MTAQINPLDPVLKNLVSIGIKANWNDLNHNQIRIHANRKNINRAAQACNGCGVVFYKIGRGSYLLLRQAVQQ